MAGTLTISTLSDGTNSTSSTNCIQGSAKAWVNFNGVGTPAIRAAFNVGSITKNGTGDYTVNFTTAMSDANYSPLASPNWDNGSLNMTTTWRDVGTSSCRVRTAYGINNTLYDALGVYVAVFR